MYENILYKPLRLRTNISQSARNILEGVSDQLLDVRWFVSQKKVKTIYTYMNFWKVGETWSSGWVYSETGSLTTVTHGELKQQPRRRLRKRHLKSKVALLQTFSRLFYLAQFVKCWYFFSGVEF